MSCVGGAKENDAARDVCGRAYMECSGEAVAMGSTGTWL